MTASHAIPTATGAAQTIKTEGIQWHFTRHRRQYKKQKPKDLIGNERKKTTHKKRRYVMVLEKKWRRRVLTRTHRRQRHETEAQYISPKGEGVTVETTTPATPTPAALRGGRRRGQSAYQREFCEMAETAAAALGATDEGLASLFKVNRRTIEKWKKAHPEFCEALRRGKEAADARVTRSLFQRAVGFSYEERKVVTGADGGQIVTVYNRVALPDVVAALKWLFNRDRGNWKASPPVEADDDTPEPKQIIIMTKDCRLPATGEPGETDATATEGDSQNSTL